MSRYIDADKLVEKAESVLDEHKTMWFDAVSVNNIYSAPTIDIVRCSECKCWDRDYVPTYCHKHEHKTKPDDFCSYGEREK